MIKNIIFDFDGVILDSVPIKTEAFRKLFEGCPKELVRQFVVYHELNGGISRYVKIRYFFEEIMKQTITEKDIEKYALKYSQLTLEELANSKYLIQDTLGFIKMHHSQIAMHIVSGADENDLKYICEKLDLSKYFLSIHGSPSVKSVIVKSLLEEYKYFSNETCLIGDSINDYEAAEKNNIAFFGYNNLELMAKGYTYLQAMSNLAV